MEEPFDRQVLAELTLAEAVLVVMRDAVDEADLTAFYKAHRGRSDTKELGFSVMVRSLWDGLTGPGKSVRGGLVKADGAGRLPVSLAAFYQKLGGVLLAVSCALFRTRAAKLLELLPTEPAGVPECLRGVAVLTVDGKVIKHVPRRRPELRLDRDDAGTLLGGRALVLRDRWTGLACDLDSDGAANAIKHAASLRRRAVAARSGSPIVGDRAFGVFEVYRNIQENLGDFLLRQHGMTKFVADPDVPERRPTDRFGRVIIERCGWITRGKQTKRRPAERIAVRQITVPRAAEPLVLITSLLDSDAHPVDALLDTYLDLAAKDAAAVRPVPADLRRHPARRGVRRPVATPARTGGLQRTALPRRRRGPDRRRPPAAPRTHRRTDPAAGRRSHPLPDTGR